MTRLIAFNVGSSSVEATTIDGRTAERSGLTMEELSDAALSIADELDVTEGSHHAHRVVHGGDLDSPQRLTDDTRGYLDDYERFASLHNPAELRVATAMQERTGRAGHAVFDTSFHQTIPDHRRTYGLPREFREAGLKQYGFHGISVRGATKGRDDNTVCLHLGSGCSVTAVEHGESKATTMGLTPFDGVIMRTRPGRLDPGVVLELLRHLSVSQADEFLNTKCGWEGLGDDTLKAQVDDDPDSLTVKAFVDSVVSEAHRVAGALTSVDTIIFTGGVGENNAVLRRRICEELNLIDTEIDDDANQAGKPRISTSESSTDVEIVECDEASTMLTMVDDAV